MQIWIIINGEKQGPFADFEVRRHISNGQYTGETIAWHEGLSEWMPLAQISVFEREFTPEAREIGNVSARPQEELPAAGAARAESYWLRRFWARWLDIYLLTGVLWLVLYASHVDIGFILDTPWLMLLIYFPWVPCEIWLISGCATTPGKWLMGLRVVNDDGSRLDLRQSTLRAVRVYFLGIGMGWGVVSPICQALSLIQARSTGKCLWDFHSKHRVEARPWQWFRLPIYGIALMMALQMQFIVVAPYVIEEAIQEYPEMAEWIEKSPPKHLPKRH
jgi:hypothetical protein